MEQLDPIGDNRPSKLVRRARGREPNSTTATTNSAPAANGSYAGLGATRTTAAENREAMAQLDTSGHNRPSKLVRRARGR